MKYIIPVLLLFSFYVSYGYTSDSIKVIVLNEHEAGISEVKVIIDDNPSFTTDRTGIFHFIPKKKLVFPFDVKVTKSGYELEEFMYYEEDKEIEIRLAKSTNKATEIMVKLVSEKNKPLTELKVKYKTKEYTTDKRGTVKLTDKTFNEKDIIVKGFTIAKVNYSPNNNIYTLKITPEETAQIKDDKISTPIIAENKAVTVIDTTTVLDEEVEISQTELQAIVFKEYSKGFDNLSKEIFAEQKRLLENNKKIRDEIERMTNKLKNEKNLSQEQRDQLKKQIDELEKTLVDNAIAYKKVETKTISMIQDLKLLVMQKDSINALTLKKLKAEEEKRKAAEMRNKRTIIIFTIITISLTFLAVAFYAIARKMKLQKKALMKADEELRLLKEQMRPGNQLVNQ